MSDPLAQPQKSSLISLINFRCIDDIAVRCPDVDISYRQLLLDVAKVAKKLPTQAYIINNCQAYYTFMVGFLAAVSKQIIPILPPNISLRAIEQLQAQFAPVSCIDDDFVAQIVKQTNDGIALAAVPMVAPERIAAIFSTSGSTGSPKTHAVPWKHIIALSSNIINRLSINSLTDTSIVSTVPMQHMYGFEHSLSLPLQLGMTLNGQQALFPADIAEVVNNNKGNNILITTPLHLKSCIATGVKLKNLQFIIVSTASLSTSLARQSEQAFQCTVYEIYGSTETGAIAMRQTANASYWTLMDGIELSVTKYSTHCHAAHFLQDMILYDQIEMFSRRKFSLHGRRTDIIKIAGKRVSLNGLNIILHEMPGVEDGCFYLPRQFDNEQESRLVAFVCAPKLTEQQILDYLRERIETVFLPRPIIKVTHLPRTTTGKLPREAFESFVQEMLYRHKGDHEGA